MNKEQHEKTVTIRERREIQQYRKQNCTPTTPTINKAKKQDHKRTIQETKTQRIAINGKHSQTTEVTKYGNIDTVQHEKQKRHTQKRKRTPTEEGSIGNSEEDQNNTSDKNNKEEESAEGKRKHKRKKPKNKRARYQQISDSSDSSDMNDDSDNDSMNDQTREEQAENRKGVG